MNELTDLTELRELFADKPIPTAERLAPARTALLAEARANEARADEARAKRRPRARMAGLPRLLLAGGLVAATVAGVIVVQAFSPSAPASAAEVLKLAAEAATATPWPDPRDDQYLHYELIAQTRAETGVRTVGPRHETGEIWASVDGSRPGLLWHKPATSGDNEYKELLTRCPVRRGHTYADLRGWPTDNEGLRRKLAEAGDQAGGGADTAARIWNGAVRVLGAPTPPTLQAAIFEIAATLPGIEKEELKDATGRPGIAVTRVGNRGPGGAVSRESLIFDKTTYAFLGGQELVPGYGRELWSMTRPRITDALPAWSATVKRKGCA